MDNNEGNTYQVTYNEKGWSHSFREEDIWSFDDAWQEELMNGNAALGFAIAQTYKERIYEEATKVFRNHLIDQMNRGFYADLTADGKATMASRYALMLAIKSVLEETQHWSFMEGLYLRWSEGESARNWASICDGLIEMYFETVWDRYSSYAVAYAIADPILREKLGFSNS